MSGAPPQATPPPSPHSHSHTRSRSQFAPVMSVRLFAQHVYDCWTRFDFYVVIFVTIFARVCAPGFGWTIKCGSARCEDRRSKTESKRETERERKTDRQFAYFTNKKCNWKGKPFLKFNCDCNSIVTFIDSCIYTHVLRTPRTCMHILLFNCRWLYWGLLSTLLNFNIAIGFLFYFRFLIGFLYFFFFIFTQPSTTTIISNRWSSRIER